MDLHAVVFKNLNLAQLEVSKEVKVEVLKHYVPYEANYIDPVRDVLCLGLWGEKPISRFNVTQPSTSALLDNMIRQIPNEITRRIQHLVIPHPCGSLSEASE